MSVTTLLAESMTILAASFVALWLMSLPLRNASIVDPFWGFGFVVVAWYSSLRFLAFDWRSILLVALTTLWGLRLTVHLLRRNIGKGEDRRYAAMRQSIGPQFWWITFFSVFLLQAILLWFIAFPLQIAISQDEVNRFSILDGLGLTVWGIGFAFETIGDWQLSRFLADPRNSGKVMDRGLWRYTRHPNYFGDACVWWGLYLIAAAGGASWTVFSPILMTLLLLRVSGVSLLEGTIADRRPGYAEYQAKTSSFVPWPPHTRTEASLSARASDV